MFFNARKNEGGHALFYTLILCPFFLGLGTVLIDLARFRAEKENLIHRATDLALHIAAPLPDNALAREVASEELSKNLPGNVQGSVIFPGDGTYAVEVALTSTTRFSFDTLFATFGVPEVHIRGLARSSASLVPIDTILAVSDGDTLRPGIAVSAAGRASLEPAWGNGSEWPSAEYLRLCTSEEPPLVPRAENLWLQRFESDDAKRWATQSCYNPVVSEYKLGMISIAQHLTRSGHDRFGMLFTPGQSGADIVRPLARTQSSTSPPLSGLLEYARELPGGWWGPNIDPLSHLGSQACALIASLPRFNRYALPDSGSTIHSSSACPWPSRSAHCASRASLLDVSSLDQCHLSTSLSPEELIYFRGVYPRIGAKRALGSLDQALQAAVLQFQTAEGNQNEGQSNRGALATHARRQFIFVSDTATFTSQEAMNRAIAEARDLGVEVVVALFQHPHLSVEELHRQESLLQTLTGSANLSDSFRIMRLSSAKELTTKLLPALISMRKQTVVRSEQEYEN